MKNTKLFIILSFLVVFSYFLENKYLPKRNSENKAKTTLIKILPGKIDYIQTTGVSFKKEEKWTYKNTEFEVDEKVILNWLKAFGDIRIIDNKKPKLAFEEDFSLVVGSRRLAFSKPNSVSGNFYARVTKGTDVEYYLVYSDMPFDGFYRDETELKKKSYFVFKDAMLNYQEHLLKKKIFASNISSFSRSIGKQSEVIIDFDNMKTNPMAYTGLTYDENAFDKYEKVLRNLPVIDVTDKLEAKKWGSLTFRGDSGEVQYEVVSSDGEYYLKEKTYYLKISQDALREILTPVYNFWGQKFDWVDNAMAGLKKIDFIKDSEQVALNFTEDFKLVAENLNTKEVQGIKEVLCYLTYCQENYKYLSVSKQNTAQYPYQLKIGDRTVLFEIKGSLISIFDPVSKVKMQYLWSLFKEGDIFKKD